MSTERQALTLPAARADLSLVCGAGGSRAILGSAGVVLAAHVAGITNWQTIGGASGGAITTLLLASGMPPKAVVRQAIEIDFSSLLTRHASPLRIFLAYFLKDSYYRIVRPSRGLLSSEKLGEFLERHVPEWPDNYWTVAAAGSLQIVFTAEGVFEYTPDGKRRVISTKPAPVGVALRASCAIPGVFDAVRFLGMDLHDGAFSVDGRTAVGAVRRHVGLAAEKILVVDVEEDPGSWPYLKRLAWNFFWRLLCGKHCPDEGCKPHGSEGTILISPDGMQIRSLQFALTADQKWHTLMCGFRAAVDAMEEAFLLTGARLEMARQILASFDEFVATSLALPGELARRTEALLKGLGLY